MRKDTQGFIQYSCSQCEKQPYLYAALGHDGPPQTFYRTNLVTGAELEECPVMTLLKAPPEIQAELQRMELEYYPMYEDGHLLVAGGLVDQPSRYLDWMRRIRDTKKRTEAAFHAKKPDEES